MSANTEAHAATRRSNKYALWYSKLSDEEKQRRKAKCSESMRNLRQARQELTTRQPRSTPAQTTTVKPQLLDGARALQKWLETLAVRDGSGSANGGLALGESPAEENGEGSHDAAEQDIPSSATTTFEACSETTDVATTTEPSLQMASQVWQLSPLGFVKDVQWVLKLFNWFVGDYERTHRYTAYLFGEGGEGKTRTVRALVQGKNVFECRLTEAYAFDGFNADVDILLIEDVNWLCFHGELRSTLLSIMARQPAVIQRKFKQQMVVENRKVLTIFTSNFKLPDDVAFRRRCYIVWADVKACIDDVAADEDDAGDDDAGYTNPKLPAAQKHNFGKRKRV